MDVAKAVAAIKKAQPAGRDHDQRVQVVRRVHPRDEEGRPDPTFWNVSFVGSKALAKELGPEGRGVEISQVVPFPWDLSVPVVREYRKLLEEAKAGDPDFGTPRGLHLRQGDGRGAAPRGPQAHRESFMRAMERWATTTWAASR